MQSVLRECNGGDSRVSRQRVMMTKQLLLDDFVPSEGGHT